MRGLCSTGNLVVLDVSPAGNSLIGTSVEMATYYQSFVAADQLSISVEFMGIKGPDAVSVSFDRVCDLLRNDEHPFHFLS
eukprot:19179_3